MRYAAILFLVIGLIGGVVAAFLPGTADVPLMGGMVVSDDGESFDFDTPAGQILTVTAVTAATPDRVRAFYQKTLPALGWTQQRDGFFTRDGDELTLTIDRQNQQTTVSFEMMLTGTR